MSYPHLIETTILEYTQSTYALGLGVNMEDLTEEERLVLEQSNDYIKDFEREQTQNLLKAARAAFERLRDIKNLPEEALFILREWTYREGDENEEGE